VITRDRAAPRGRGRPAPSGLPPGQVEVREEVRPPWPFRLGSGRSPDGLLRRRGAAVQRWLHVDDAPVLVGIIQPAADRVLFAARGATEEAARAGIARMRFATSVDEDYRPFYEAFRSDRLIGRAVRMNPHLRPWRKPDPWEALYAAVTEQLIELHRATAIQRRLIRAFGRRCAETGMRDAPTPSALADATPARLASFDLSPSRALTLRRAAREVATGRVDLADPSHEAGWRRLRAIPGIGPWTVEMLAYYGQGRHDQIPAGDLSYLKLVGRLTTGNPRARADVAEVYGLFDRFGEWRGLAGDYARWAAHRGMLRYPTLRYG
jgi:DNA-3-methyladenine glycosylase II